MISLIFLDSRQGKKKAWSRPINLMNRKLNSRIETAENNDEKQIKGKRLKKPSYLLNHYIANSSIHGLRYVLDPELYNVERFVWLLFFITSIVATTYAACIVTAQFQVIINFNYYIMNCLIFTQILKHCYKIVISLLHTCYFSFLR